MELSLFLAKVMGLYLAIVSLAVLLRRKELRQLVAAFAEDNLFIFFSGGVILILGLLVVVSHNVWEADWRGVITFLGWLTVAKGAIRLFFPEFAKNSSRKVVASTWYWPIVGLSFLVGLWLASIGFGY